jgi:hypothetical protein
VVMDTKVTAFPSVSRSWEDEIKLLSCYLLYIEPNVPLLASPQGHCQRRKQGCSLKEWLVKLGNELLHRSFGGCGQALLARRTTW